MPFSTFLHAAELDVIDERSLPDAFDNGEFGVRATTLISGFDLAVFFFDYHDRFPSYSLSVTNPSPLTINLTGNHSRIRSYGFTGSKISAR